MWIRVEKSVDATSCRTNDFRVIKNKKCLKLSSLLSKRRLAFANLYRYSNVAAEVMPSTKCVAS